MNTNAEDKSCQAERLSPAAHSSHGQPRHHLPGREHQAARHGRAVTLTKHRAGDITSSYLSTQLFNLWRADWNACMNPVSMKVGIRISIFLVRIEEQNLADVVFQVSGENILFDVCGLISVDIYGC